MHHAFKLDNNEGQQGHIIKKTNIINNRASEVPNDRSTRISETIINLSDYKLKQKEIDLLAKGLSFIPTPKIDSNHIKNNVSDFSRRLKLKHYFDKYPNKEKAKSTIPCQTKSNWNPSEKLIDNELSKCISSFKEKINNLTVIRETQNIPKLQRKAIKNLKNNSKIVIKKADKGTAVVILNKIDYIFEAERQLKNNLHYRELDNPIYPDTSNKIKLILREMYIKNLITKRQFDYLNPPTNPRPRRFYLLPKIHKPELSWTVPMKIPPGRPIVSDCNSESEKVAEFIDNFLKPYSITHKSYIKDTYHFLDNIKNLKIPENSLLVTLDVESMYTNISHEKGIESIKKTISNDHDPRLNYIIDLLELSLKCNDFEFNNKFYLQVQGTSMGKKFAPHYADIYMADFETNALANYPIKPHTYLRYLDDIFIIWPHTLTTFNEFLASLNNQESSIKFKATVSNESIIFLDTVIFKNPKDHSQLLSKVHFKPTDNHQLLHKKSFHPKHTFSGVVKSQITRFYRICSLESDFDTAWKTLYDSLARQGYARRFLRKIKTKTLDLLKRQYIPLPFHMQSTSNAGAKPCKGSHRCLTCNLITPCHNFESSNTELNYPINKPLDCSSSNLIYLFTCKFCLDQYVGETERNLRDRVGGHRNDFKRKNMDNALFKHCMEKHFPFFLTNRTVTLETFYILTPIEQIEENENQTRTYKKLKRLQRENFWIKTLVTLYPQGINQVCFEPKIKEQKRDFVPLILPFSKTSCISAKIIKDHINELKSSNMFDFDLNILTTYSKHKNLKDLLVSSKLK